MRMTSALMKSSKAKLKVPIRYICVDFQGRNGAGFLAIWQKVTQSMNQLT